MYHFTNRQELEYDIVDDRIFIFYEVNFFMHHCTNLIMSNDNIIDPELLNIYIATEQQNIQARRLSRLILHTPVAW